jgi:pantothenate kinase type III
MQVAYENVRFLDVGNTTVILMSYDGKSFKNPRRFLTKYFKASQLKDFLKGVTVIVASNVVDELQKPLEEFFNTMRVKSFFIQKKKAQYINYALKDGEVGADIVAQLEGGAFAYQYPCFCVVGMGTAITITTVEDSFFKGGLIGADYKMQLESLYYATSKLPFIKAHLSQLDKGLFQIDSVKAIKSGSYNLIYYGIKGIIDAMKKEKPHLRVIGTGGFSFFFEEIFDHHAPNLLFLGLLTFFNKNIEIGLI